VPAPPFFPLTRHSVVASLASSDAEIRRPAFDALVTAYWKPAFKYLRLKWHANPEEAADLTQAFFLRAFEKDFFASFDSGKARFRTYLRTCLDRFVSNQRQHDRRLKRGGAVEVVSLDFEAAEAELRQPAGNAVDDFDAYFHREWLRSLFSDAVDRLRAECQAVGKATRYEVFARYDLAGEPHPRPTYAEMARALGLAVTDVTNELSAARRDLRRIVLDVLRERCVSDEEFEREKRAL
jgi:RNA polymerase sigma factor (sigma-70 family)